MSRLKDRRALSARIEQLESQQKSLRKALLAAVGSPDYSALRSELNVVNHSLQLQRYKLRNLKNNEPILGVASEMSPLKYRPEDD